MRRTPYVTLNANITSGIPALTTYFSVSTEMPNPVSLYQMDFEGDGVIDYTGPGFDNVSFTYTAEGIHNPKVTVTDTAGNTYTDTIAITVLNREKIDTLLKAKWEGMKGKLMAGDIEGALGCFAEETKAEYRGIFELIQRQLPDLGLQMGEIKIITLGGNMAEYYITRYQRGTDISYFLYFRRNVNGVWKLFSF